MRKLLVVAVAALGIAAGTAPLQAQTAEHNDTGAKGTSTSALLHVDSAKRAWFERAVEDILAGPEREADQGQVEQGRSSGR